MQAAKRRRAEAPLAGGSTSQAPPSEELPDMLKRQCLKARLLFLNGFGAFPAQDPQLSEQIESLKLRRMYNTTKAAGGKAAPALPLPSKKAGRKLIAGPPGGPSPPACKSLPAPTGAGQLVVHGNKEEARKAQERENRKNANLTVLPMTGAELRALHEKNAPKPQWHAPWKLHRVIAGHLGWVRTIAVDHSNEWFASSGADRTIKIWDLATGTLKLTLTGHISAVRGLAVSARSPYLFSCAEDGKVMCWDLEQNRVVRNYHGHLNGVYSLSLHPGLDILASGGRDASVRVWDIRTKAEIHCMTGHTSSVSSLTCLPTPQIISGSQDSQIRIWDLAAGKCDVRLTHHKKGVRALAMHPSEFTFVSGAPDNLKKWRCPKGEFMMNFSGHDTIINGVAVNQQNVLVSGGLDGTLKFWDWKTGYNFQTEKTIAQPGSLEAEASVYCTAFDHSGSRLITGEGDKSIKIWKEDETATPDTHPVGR